MKFVLMIICILLLSGCYNRYNVPLIWEGTAYPIIKPETMKNSCIQNTAIYVQVIDDRMSNIGKMVNGSNYPAELIQDNELKDVQSFIGERMCASFDEAGIKCGNLKKNRALVQKLNKKILDIKVNVVTPNVRGAVFMSAYGIVELEASLYDPQTSVANFKKVYSEVAKDGDKDIPLPWYSAVTIEQAGKLVTATSVKRIADELINDLCPVLQK